MINLCAHNWSWPRRRGDRDVQTCVACGVTRLSSIQFKKTALSVPPPLTSPNGIPHTVAVERDHTSSEGPSAAQAAAPETGGYGSLARFRWAFGYRRRAAGSCS
jgi:hypothetical protein